MEAKKQNTSVNQTKMASESDASDPTTSETKRDDKLQARVDAFIKTDEGTGKEELHNQTVDNHPQTTKNNKWQTLRANLGRLLEETTDDKGWTHNNIASCRYLRHVTTRGMGSSTGDLGWKCFCHACVVNEAAKNKSVVGGDKKNVIDGYQKFRRNDLLRYRRLKLPKLIL